MENELVWDNDTNEVTYLSNPHVDMKQYHNKLPNFSRMGDQHKANWQINIKQIATLIEIKFHPEHKFFGDMSNYFMT